MPRVAACAPTSSVRRADPEHAVPPSWLEVSGPMRCRGWIEEGSSLRPARRATAGAALMAAALVASASWTAPAQAQTPASGGAATPATTPAGSAAAPAPAGSTAQATARYEAGVQAAKQGRWPEAYAAFLEAWQVKQHPQIAANLGRAALMTGKPREAAERLTYFLREARDVSAEDRAKVEELLANARKQIGVLTLSVSREGAELLVDGASVGKAPVSGEIFVDPGRRVVEARVPGQPTARVEVEVAAGSTQHVGLWLVEAEAPRGPVAPTAPVVKEEGSGGARAYLVGAGIAATVAGVGAGVALGVAANSSATMRDDRPEEWERWEGERWVLSNASFWSFVAAGAIGAGTLGYVLLAPRSKGDAAVRVEARGTGVSVRGAW